jgi:homoprotocatechuate degradation regulator HpaR
LPRAASATPPPALRARRNLPLLLLQARGGLIARFRPVLKKTGLTEQQFRILRALDVYGTLEPRELCAICHISSPSLAGVLARMEAVDLVHRVRLKDDQRRQHISLTPRAEKMFSDVSTDLEAVYLQLEADLGPEFVQQVYAMLDRLLSVLDTSGGGASPSGGEEAEEP